eukprot:347812-Chlamydomonas_euryale.AAC.1
MTMPVGAARPGLSNLSLAISRYFIKQAPGFRWPVSLLWPVLASATSGSTFNHVANVLAQAGGSTLSWVACQHVVLLLWLFTCHTCHCDSSSDWFGGPLALHHTLALHCNSSPCSNPDPDSECSRLTVYRASSACYTDLSIGSSLKDPRIL